MVDKHWLFRIAVLRMFLQHFGYERVRVFLNSAAQGFERLPSNVYVNDLLSRRRL